MAAVSRPVVNALGLENSSAAFKQNGREPRLHLEKAMHRP
jgi:hypothetical protein